MKRIFSILASLALLASLASDGLAQRGVGVRARQNAGAEKRVALVIGNSEYGRQAVGGGHRAAAAHLLRA